jgi:hypothetical protein
MKKPLIIIATGLFLAGCGSSQTEKQEADLMAANADTAQTIKISQDVLDAMMQTLPSPIETANLITQSKSGFNKALLIPSKNASRFPDKYSQALALGGYGVDLGYLNLNDKVLYMVEYLESVHTVSKELKVDQFMDFSTLNNLAKNKNNVDSLILLSTKNFKQMDEYLRSQNRGDLSVLILVGSWIEGLHMFTKIAKENPSQEINTRIGEQKIIIDNIYAILDKLENVPYYKGLKIKLDGLKAVYANVKIEYIYKAPEMKEVNGQLEVIDNSTSVVTITQNDIETIEKEISKLRASVFEIN